MDPLKDIRWKQRFENFEKTYILLKKYSDRDVSNELERAGVIQFFEMTLELSWKVMKDYLEFQGYVVKTPRETIKQAYQSELIADGHTWLEALSRRNLTTHTYDEEVARKLINDIRNQFLPVMTELYETLLEEK